MFADEIEAIRDRAGEAWATENFPEMSAKDRIALVAGKVTARFEPLVPHLKAVSADEVDSFAALSPLS
jgi:hypothetical protein